MNRLPVLDDLLHLAPGCVQAVSRDNEADSDHKSWHASSVAEHPRLCPMLSFFQLIALTYNDAINWPVSGAFPYRPGGTLAPRAGIDTGSAIGSRLAIPLRPENAERRRR